MQFLMPLGHFRCKKLHQTQKKSPAPEIAGAPFGVPVKIIKKYWCRCQCRWTKNLPVPVPVDQKSAGCRCTAPSPSVVRSLAELPCGPALYRPDPKFSYRNRIQSGNTGTGSRNRIQISKIPEPKPDPRF